VFSKFFLLTQRYSKLGAIASLPITVNIFVITLSYYFAFTPVITGLLVLSNVLLLLWEWDELKILLNVKPKLYETRTFEDDVVWQVTGLTLFLFTFTYRLFYDKYDFVFWFLTFAGLCFVGLLIGMLRYRKRKIVVK